MAKVCGAVAKSTGERCRHRPLLGSAYCFFHIEYAPVFYGALLGAIASLALSQTWAHFVPSAESKQLYEATKERDTLRSQVSNLEMNLQDEQERAEQRSIEHSKQLARLETRLEPFLNLAAQRFPELPPDDALAKLRADLNEVRAMATPPTIELERTIKKPNEPFTLILRFKKSKAGPLGTVAFQVDLPAGTDTILNEISPAQNSMNVRSSISEDGRTGILTYAIPGSGPPAIQLKFSAQTAFQLQGSHGLGTLDFAPE